MFEEPFANGFYVEYGSLGRTNWMLEGLQTRGAKVEWQSFEVCAIWCFLIDIGAGAGRISIRRRPLRVGDV